LEKVTTLAELETHWSLDDMVRANEALDALHEAQKQANKK
jgi:hypothetical protein